MPLRLVQAGAPAGPVDNRPLVLCFLVGSDMDPSLRAALGPSACIVADVDAKGPQALTALRAFAAQKANLPAGAPLVLVGFSLGCSKVRTLLGDRALSDLVAVLTLDGTHASMPPRPDQLEPWEKLAGQARASTTLWVATHTMNTYVETLRPPAGPFLSTWSVLKLVTGLPLAELGTVDTPEAGMVREGDLVIYGFASKSCDAVAHGMQLRRVMPYMLATHMRPWLVALGCAEATDLPAPAPASARPIVLGTTATARGPEVLAWQRWLERAGFAPGRPDGVFGPATKAATVAFQKAAGLTATGTVDLSTHAEAEVWKATPSPAVPPTAAGFVAALLEAARADVGARETAGPNRGPTMKMFQDEAGVPEGSEYCAAAVKFWKDAAEHETGLQATIAGSPGAKATMAELQAAGAWTDRAELASALVPGMVLVWDRGGWHGHTGIVEWVDAKGIHTIEANAGPGDGVYRMLRQLADPALLGGGLLVRS